MILERIKQFIDSKGISVSAFEKSIGMSNASFGKSLKNGGAIGTDKLENILRVYSELSPIWLLTGKGEMLQASPSNQSNLDDRVLNLIRDQAEEIGKLKQRIIELERRLEKDAANANTDTIANAG